MRAFARSGAVLALAAALCLAAVSPARAATNADIAYGKDLFQEKGYCSSCHGWAGDGQGAPHSTGNAANLRKTILNRQQLIEIISCGRPGADMPHFDPFAYREDSCYGMSAASLGADMPPQPPHRLQRREIEAIVDYLEAKVVGKGAPTQAECLDYFGPDLRCNAYPGPTVSPAEVEIAYGKRLFQDKGYCASCHGWAGDGQGAPHSTGNAANLRKTILNRQQLIEIISCGRPGADMPRFDAFAYREDSCYGMSAASVGSDMPPPPPHLLQRREIEAIVDYLEAKVVGKGAPTKAECRDYFGAAAPCDAVFSANSRKDDDAK